jgi:hypothetical protein
MTLFLQDAIEQLCLKVSSEEVMWYYSKMVIDVTRKVVNHSKDAGVTIDCKAIHSALG